MPVADDNMKSHYLYPGNIFASATPHLVTTVLGSCIAVCMYDPTLKIGGINHYMLPLWNGEGLASPRYGNIAITKLLDRMLALGCEKTRLKAKMFGGGEVLKMSQNVLHVGQRNIQLATDLLKEINIPVIARDIGGKEGRKIIYNTQSGTVRMKKLRRI